MLLLFLAPTPAWRKVQNTLGGVETLSMPYHPWISSSTDARLWLSGVLREHTSWAQIKCRHPVLSRSAAASQTGAKSFSRLTSKKLTPRSKSFLCNSSRVQVTGRRKSPPCCGPCVLYHRYTVRRLNHAATFPFSWFLDGSPRYARC